MNKRARAVSAIAAVAAVSGAPCYGHSSDAVFPIYEVPTANLPDLGDGTLADWEESVPAPSLVPLDFVPWLGVGGQQDLADLAVGVFLAWHAQSQRIYVGMQVLDDRHVGGYEGGGIL